MRELLVLPALAILILLAHETGVDELISQAEKLFPQRYIRENLEEMIRLYEAVLPHLDTLSVQSQSFVLNRLSQLYYELTTFSEGDTPEDRELFMKGKEYGFRSLELNREFSRWQLRDFSKALSFITDPAALYWTANNWGTLFGYNPLEGLANVDKVKAMYERCLQVDESYWGGSCHNALGALLVTLPGFLGGNPEAGRVHLERAIGIDPEYLQNRVVYAEFWGFTYDILGNRVGIRARELIETQLNYVLEAPIGERWPFWNREAKKGARRLLEELERLSGEG
jgi:hypothetical protein